MCTLKKKGKEEIKKENKERGERSLLLFPLMPTHVHEGEKEDDAGPGAKPV